ncbi:MAG: hypothetical protein Q7R70_06555 [Candidatus Diapherotrites archaeon]|nr:hypothetical protein [Candidatus Diapherotrites archaeon]
MPSRQYNKLFGLKKLKKIAQSVPQASVTPFKVYSRPEQFRLSHSLEQPRLLARTDEKGRQYKRLRWEEMPRGDAVTKNRSESEIHKWLNSFQYNQDPLDSFSGRNRMLLFGSRKRFIVHPTRERSKIAVTGAVRIEKGIIEIWINENPSAQEKIHRRLFSQKSILSDIGNLDKLNPRVEKNKLPANVIAFLKSGVKTGQIKLGRKLTELSFLSWKEAASMPEFFDLIEKRQDSIKKTRGS